MGEWKSTTLGDVITLQRGFDLPSQKRMPGKIPIVSSSGITDYHSEVGVKGPGVVTGRYGTIGQVFLIKQDYWPLNTTLWVKDFHGNDPQFVSYLLRTIDFLSCSDKSSVPGVNRNDLHRIPVLLPPLPEQKRIAHILGTLDDKIELNRRMNATLEAMARALFKSWFVDFDPVHAKLDGRKPEGLDPETAALFPSAFQETPLGPIPKGWHVKRIGEIADRIAMGPFGSRITKDNFVDVGVPVIRGNNLTDGFNEDRFVFVTSEKASELKNSIAERGDIVFTHRGTLGQVGLIPAGSQYPKYIVSQSQMLLRINKGVLSPEVIYDFFKSASGQQALLANTSQTGVPAIAQPTTSLKSISLSVPPLKVSEAYEARNVPLRRQQVQNTKQAQILATLRDTLLPRLLSGEH